MARKFEPRSGSHFSASCENGARQVPALGLGRASPVLVSGSCWRNSIGLPAHLVAEGSTSIAEHDVIFTGSLVAPTFGVLVQVDQTATTPLGSGLLCVGGTVARSAPAASTAGRLQIVLDPTAPLAPAAAIVAGSVSDSQIWFRDAGAGAQTSNLTDAVRLELRP